MRIKKLGSEIPFNIYTHELIGYASIKKIISTFYIDASFYETQAYLALKNNPLFPQGQTRIIS